MGQIEDDDRIRVEIPPRAIPALQGIRDKLAEFDSRQKAQPIRTTEPIQQVLTERTSRYGAFADHAALTQRLKLMMHAHPKWASLPPDMKEALEMIQHKIGRILSGDPAYQDSWVDIEGYARLVSQRLGPDQSPLQSGPSQPRQ